MATNDGGAGGAGGEGGGAGGAADLIGEAGAGGGAGEGGGQGGGGGAGEGGEGGADPDWYAQLSGDPGEGEASSNRDYVKSKGFKDLDGLTKAYRAAEKAIHDKGLVKLPGEGATAEETAAFRKAIGVPEKVEDYAMPVVKDAEGNALEMNSDKLTFIAQKALERGIPKAALEGLLQDVAENDAAELATREGELKAAAAKHANAWGADKDAKLAAVDAAAEALKLSSAELLKMRAALGPERSLDVLAQIGTGISEDTLLKGGRIKFMGDPKSSQRRLDELKSNPKILQKGTPEAIEYERHLEIVAAAADREGEGAQPMSA